MPDELHLEDKLPLLFLIDEIFKGTNNKERLLGSGVYIKSLAGLNGLEAISTHNLEMTKLEDSVPGLTNYHFREEVVDGKMVFDYKMRPEPCPFTNALKIMKLEGLPVALNPTPSVRHVQHSEFKEQFSNPHNPVFRHCTRKLFG